MVKASAHVLAGTLFLAIMGVVLRGLVLVDYERLPCERTLQTRSANVNTAPPGATIRISGLYQIMRDGCVATFHPLVTWQSHRGLVQEPMTRHGGSFDVSEKGPPMTAARLHTLPLDAEVGSHWTHTVHGIWDAWQLPLRLSQIKVDYANVSIRIEDLESTQ